ncbi:MAG: heavy-metal-associated domain-containing protein [Clostridia bacterium]|nr:heavy-metal-associated domain-containing protein [Clostridia bacterium]
MLGRKRKGALVKRVHISGMVNRHSTMRITEALCNVQGLTYVYINLKKEYADLTYYPFFPTEQVKRTIEHLGYKIVSIEDMQF